MLQIAIPVPDGKSGDWAVETFEVTKEQSAFSRIRSFMHPEEYVEAGTYKRLTRRGQVIMSNTSMEIATNRAIIWQGTGCILINGLGLGMVVTELLKKPIVTEITVIENSEDVIKLVAPTFEHDKRFTVLHADAFDYQPPKGKRYNCVWHDIWDNICSDNLPEMTRLVRKYARRADWQGCWSKIECLRAKRRGF